MDNYNLMKHVYVCDMCSTYQHIYLPVPPEKPQRVEESIVWYGSLEFPFLPAIKHKIPTIHVQNEPCCFFLLMLMCNSIENY